MRELIAEIVHEQWASWMRYQLSRSVEIGGARTRVLVTDARQWMRQANTPYEDLSEAEKESDREWADKYLAVLRPVVSGKDTYNHRLDTLTAIFVMGWKLISLASGEVAWSTPTQELVYEWSPTSNNAHLGMLLGKMMDGNEWLATICGRETDDTSWRVGLVKAIAVYCGGSLPDEPLERKHHG